MIVFGIVVMYYIVSPGSDLSQEKSVLNYRMSLYRPTSPGTSSATGLTAVHSCSKSPPVYSSPVSSSSSLTPHAGWPAKPET